MLGIRWILPCLFALVVVAPADAVGITVFSKKPKSEAQVKKLVETIRMDPDEKKRRAAIADLRDADPRLHTDLIPALLAALQRDPVPQVRADAAEAIGQFKVVFPVAGLALEAAAESDASRAVRDSAQQSLWEYHLVGYRSAKGADGIAGQTAEPPLAKPALARATIPHPMNAAIQPPGPPLAVMGGLPTIGSRPPRVAPLTSPIVAIGMKPAVTGLEALRPTAAIAVAGPRIILTSAPPMQLNVSVEPPFAKPRLLPVSPAPRDIQIQISRDATSSERSAVAAPALRSEDAASRLNLMRFDPALPGPRVRSR